MKRVRWLKHAVVNLEVREIDRSEIETTLQSPDYVVPSWGNLRILMRKYFDVILQQDMLLRIVVEETYMETDVVTIYKTSQIERYAKGL